MSAEFMTIYYSNGQKYTEGNWEDNIPIGDHIIWHETGGRKYQSIDFEDTPTMVTEWYENGQKKSKGAQSHGRLDYGLNGMKMAIRSQRAFIAPYLMMNFLLEMMILKVKSARVCGIFGMKMDNCLAPVFVKILAKNHYGSFGTHKVMNFVNAYTQQMKLDD